MKEEVCRYKWKCWNQFFNKTQITIWIFMIIETPLKIPLPSIRDMWWCLQENGLIRNKMHGRSVGDGRGCMEGVEWRMLLIIRRISDYLSATMCSLTSLISLRTKCYEAREKLHTFSVPYKRGVGGKVGMGFNSMSVNGTPSDSDSSLYVCVILFHHSKSIRFCCFHTIFLFVFSLLNP